MFACSARRRSTITTAVALAAIAGAACNNSDTSGPAAFTTVVRLINVAPYAGATDVYDSTSPSSRKLVVSNLAYSAFDSIVTIGGTHWYDFTLTGKSPTLAAAGTISFLTNTTYDVALLDSLAGGTTPSYAGQVLPVILPDTVSTNTKVRVVHASPKAGALDLYITTPGTSFTAAGSPTVADLTFGQNTSANGNPTYLSATPGSTEIRLTATGDTTTVDVDSTVALTADQALTVFAVQNPSDSTKTILLIIRDH
jgi:hypothetical protein